MFESEQNTTTLCPMLAEELSRLQQEFSAFNDYFAFFTDAFVRVVSSQERVDVSTLQGMRRCCRWMQQRMDELNRRIAELAHGTDTGNG